jgi:hypothetical protein
MQSKYVNAIRELVHHTLMRYNLAMLPTLLCHGPAAMQGLGTIRGTKNDKSRLYRREAVARSYPRGYSGGIRPHPGG